MDNKDEQVDWLREYSKLLLLTAKYMSCVGAYEGTVFLYKRDWPEGDWEMLKILDTMSKDMDFFKLSKEIKG